MSRNTYSRPFPIRLHVLAMSDRRVHTGAFRHSIDFVVPLGTAVLAAEAGRVHEVHMVSSQGGADPQYAGLSWVNYIVLSHDNDEFSLYGHLALDKNPPRLGSCVCRGDKIGQTGMSGLMTLPHLHFHVYVEDKPDAPRSVEIVFAERIVVHHPTRSSAQFEPIFTLYSDNQ